MDQVIVCPNCETEHAVGSLSCETCQADLFGIRPTAPRYRRTMPGHAANDYIGTGDYDPLGDVRSGDVAAPGEASDNSLEQPTSASPEETDEFADELELVPEARSLNGGVGASFVVGGRAWGNLRELAFGLASNWSESIAKLKDGSLFDHLTRKHAAHSMGVTIADVKVQMKTSADLALFRLIIGLDPSIPPIFRGYVLTLDSGLQTLAENVGRGDQDADEVVGSLYESRVLSDYGTLARNKAYEGFDFEWHEVTERFRAHLHALEGNLDRALVARLSQHNVVLDVFKALASAGRRDQVISAAAALKTSSARSRAWFHDLSAGLPALDVALAMLLVGPVAEEEAAQALEATARQKAAAATIKKQAALDAERKRAEAEILKSAEERSKVIRRVLYGVSVLPSIVVAGVATIVYAVAAFLVLGPIIAIVSLFGHLFGPGRFINLVIPPLALVGGVATFVYAMVRCVLWINNNSRFRPDPAARGVR